MKIRVTFDYEIPEGLTELFKTAGPIKAAENVFLDELRNNENIEGEISLEHAEIVE